MPTAVARDLVTCVWESKAPKSFERKGPEPRQWQKIYLSTLLEEQIGSRPGVHQVMKIVARVEKLLGIESSAESLSKLRSRSYNFASKVLKEFQRHHHGR